MESGRPSSGKMLLCVSNHLSEGYGGRCAFPLRHICHHILGIAAVAEYAEDDGDSACHLGKHVRHPALGDGDVAHEGVGQARLPSFVENPQRKLAYMLGKPRPAFRGNLVAIGEAGVDREVLHDEGGDEEHPHRRARRPHRRDVRSTRHDLGDDEGQKCERRQLDDVCRSGQDYRLREPARLAARNAVDHTHFPSPPGVPRRRFDGRLPQAPVHSVLGQELFVRALLDHLAAV